MGPNQSLFDEWGLEGFSWLFLAPPGGTQPVQFNKKETAIWQFLIGCCAWIPSTQEEPKGARGSQEVPGKAPWLLLIKESLMRGILLYSLTPKPMRNCLLAPDSPWLLPGAARSQEDPRGARRSQPGGARVLSSPLLLVSKCNHF